MKISLGMPIPDLGSLPGSRPGGGGNSLFGFTASTAPKATSSLACAETSTTTFFKSTSPATPVAVGNIIFREQAGTTFANVGYYSDATNYYEIVTEGVVNEIGTCTIPILSFNSTTEPEANSETICAASIEGKMYKEGSNALAVGNIVYKDVAGSELADEGFYKITGNYYQIGGSGNVLDITAC